MKKYLFAAAILSTATPGWTATPKASDTDAPEVSIQFADRLRFEDYQPIDNETVYLQLRTGQWYRAIVSGCVDLTKRVTIGYRFNADGSFDRNSTLHVNGVPCPVESLIESGPPPRKVGSNRRMIWVPGV